MSDKTAAEIIATGRKMVVEDLYPQMFYVMIKDEKYVLANGIHVGMTLTVAKEILNSYDITSDIFLNRIDGWNGESSLPGASISFSAKEYPTGHFKDSTYLMSAAYPIYEEYVLLQGAQFLIFADENEVIQMIGSSGNIGLESLLM